MCIIDVLLVIDYGCFTSDLLTLKFVNLESWGFGKKFCVFRSLEI